ncbi:MAG: flagellar assembly protein FliH [Gammaproteobacteria bacterium]
MSDGIIKNNPKNSTPYILEDISVKKSTGKKTAFDNSTKKLTAAEVGDIEAQARKEGYEIGFKEGHRDGLITGEADVNARIRKFTALIQSLNKPLEDLDDEVIEQLVQLSITVSRQIIRRELKIDPGQVMAVVRESMSILPATARDIKIYLHPEDAKLVREILSVDEDADRPWKIVDDPVLTHGSCRIQSENSFIDASVEQRLNQVISDLLGDERVTDTDS